MLYKRNGFTAVAAILIALAVLALSGGAYLLVKKQQENKVEEEQKEANECETKCRDMYGNNDNARVQACLAVCDFSPEKNEANTNIGIVY